MTDFNQNKDKLSSEEEQFTNIGKETNGQTEKYNYSQTNNKQTKRRTEEQTGKRKQVCQITEQYFFYLRKRIYFFAVFIDQSDLL